MITRPWLVVRPRRLPISFRVDRRVPIVLLGALLVTLAAMVINIGVGEYPVASLDVVRTVLGLPTGNPTDAFIVNTLRLPRMLVAALVGLGLGVAGAILQGLTRNPLAEPAILGISSGAGLVAVTLIVVVRNVPGVVISTATFTGALLITGMIYLLAWRGGDSPIRLVLVGVGFSSVASALISVMITFGNIDAVQRALVWLTGSVYGSTWSEVWALLPWVVVFVPLAVLLARDLNALSLGEEVARGLGSTVGLRRGLLLMTAVALVATTVAA
ncbi:MAG TPA: iron ABC transporter permease, partial [Herpetosiphonaceae bacterium]